MKTVVELPTQPKRARRPGPWLLLGAIVLGIDLLVVGGTLGQLGIRFDTGAVIAANGVENPVLYLGSAFDRTDCKTVPLSIGAGYSVFCDDWSAITSVDYSTQVVSLYAAGNGVVDEYPGPLPRSLRWHEGLTEILDTLGNPRRVTGIYGTPTLVYMYTGSPYGSLELRFDANLELVKVNACLTH
jgi:hypothetical protein